MGNETNKQQSNQYRIMKLCEKPCNVINQKDET